MAAADPSRSAPHIPVLLRPLLAAAAPVEGVWVDGTFGAGGYAKGLLDAGAAHVVGIDRDPTVFPPARAWAGDYGERLTLIEGTFSELDQHAGGPVDGVVLDLGVSSMQLDQPERGFSFQKDGPLDMRMGDEGADAADLVNSLPDGTLADILFHYGEERASRRIARAIVAARADRRIETTGRLAEIVAGCLPRQKPGQSHPATRSFQALRIAVNDEFGQLVDGLEAAERALRPGGVLAVVSFHSLEDRVVKRFFQERTDGGGQGNRYAPVTEEVAPRFERMGKAVGADEEEMARNPRARSAMLRMGRRTDAPAGPVDRTRLGLPKFDIREVSVR
ncbi:16S rRNA (cytosine1402-N4)-methyltransferase [Tranquillimonas rosea]|uniref:Ribosomal RNA small subunit methyltransferase H n=1 Tax=Tranquillimonas rosea TaxID=641238 RepID=A0A1H9V0A7_9RHOB|nr:16S rRNA (cytosine(1402)-N(4))-methyltransferase RsmH [Tranquillimonas rosea]SES14814.1 16S rRNA (cytosine1402-N4)-methyltransferase [Tranquillimonas rosea]